MWLCFYKFLFIAFYSLLDIKRRKNYIQITSKHAKNCQQIYAIYYYNLYPVAAPI